VDVNGRESIAWNREGNKQARNCKRGVSKERLTMTYLKAGEAMPTKDSKKVVVLPHPDPKKQKTPIPC